MTMDEIIEYAIKSPENTNPNVLRSMLGQINSSAAEPSEFSSTNILEIHDVNNTLDKTWQEINDAIMEDKIVYLQGDYKKYVATINSRINEQDLTDYYIVFGIDDYYLASATTTYPAKQTDDSLTPS